MDISIQARAYNKGFADGYSMGLADGLSGKERNEEVEILRLPLEHLDLSTRVKNSLLHCGCVRIADVTGMKKEQIYRIRNLGRTGMDEVAKALHKNGIFHSDWDAFLYDYLVNTPQFDLRRK